MIGRSRSAVATQGNRAIFTNDDGAWTIWRTTTRNPQSGAVVGPGQRLRRLPLARARRAARRPAGGRPADDRDRVGGHGLRRQAAVPRPLHVRVYDRRVEQQVDVAAAWDGAGPRVFVKEPKLTCHSIGPVGGPRYRWFALYAQNGDPLLTDFDIWSLPDPDKHTKQLRQQRRCRLVFTDENAAHPLTVVMMGLGAQGRVQWCGGEGPDRWAREANGWEALRGNGVFCKPYCLQGPLDAAGHRTLSRNWELGRWASAGIGSPPDAGRPQVGVGFHFWEGVPRVGLLLAPGRVVHVSR